MDFETAVAKPTPFETLAGPFSRLVFSAADDSLLRRPFRDDLRMILGLRCSIRAVASIFRQISFWNSDLADTAADFWGSHSDK
jgi:hypothetical protein